VIGVLIGIVVVVIAFNMIQGDSVDGEVAAVVNGEIITVDELNGAYASLSPQYQASLTKESLLDELVQAKIIYQEAIKENLGASEEEARQAFEEAKILSGLTEEQLATNLEAQGVTEQELIDQYAKQLTIQNYLDVNLLNQIEITDEQIEEYYNSNPGQFQVEEQVVVRHILIGDEDLSEEEQKTKAEGILSELTEANFCDAVEEHTTDVASVATCGEYKFGMSDPLVEGFKALSFEQEPREMGIVKTQFGEHIIWTVAKIPSTTTELDDIREEVREFLKTEEGRDLYDGFVEELTEGSDIEIEFVGL